MWYNIVMNMRENFSDLLYGMWNNRATDKFFDMVHGIGRSSIAHALRREAISTPEKNEERLAKEQLVDEVIRELYADVLDPNLQNERYEQAIEKTRLRLLEEQQKPE